MTDAQVLIASDDPESARLWALGISQRYIPAIAVRLEEDFAETQISGAFGLIALDVSDPEPQIVALCRDVRAAFEGPILLCSHERDERFHVRVYEAGIDESITKPIGIPLFLAKVMAWLRRSAMPSVQQYDLPATSFHLETAHRVLTTPDGNTSKLSSLEFRLLMILMDNRGRAVGSEVLIDGLWGHGEGRHPSLKNLVYRLRQKVEPLPGQPQYIETVAGHGYRFRVQNAGDSLPNTL